MNKKMTLEGLRNFINSQEGDFFITVDFGELLNEEDKNVACQVTKCFSKSAIAKKVECKD